LRRRKDEDRDWEFSGKSIKALIRSLKRKKRKGRTESFNEEKRGILYRDWDV
jgi:hypothetical protein